MFAPVRFGGGMVNKILDTISRYNMLKEGDSVIVGVSGGADSVALLHSLFSLKEQLGLTIHACHINHNLRGEESQRDENFVRAFCGELNIPLTVFSIDVQNNVEKHESTEERARKMLQGKWLLLAMKNN